MSLARFGPESDVYIYETGTDDCAEFFCCRCSLVCTNQEPLKNVQLNSLEFLIAHLNLHKERGDKVAEAFSNLAYT